MVASSDTNFTTLLQTLQSQAARLEMKRTDWVAEKVKKRKVTKEQPEADGFIRALRDYKATIKNQLDPLLQDRILLRRCITGDRRGALAWAKFLQSEESRNLYEYDEELRQDVDRFLEVFTSIYSEVMQEVRRSFETRLK